MSIPSIPDSTSPAPAPAATPFLDSIAAGTSQQSSALMDILLKGWLAGLDEMSKASAQDAKTSEITDASNLVSLYPTLVQPQSVITNSTVATSTENASKAQGSEGLSGISTDVPAKSASAVYAYLMTHEALGSVLSSKHSDHSVDRSQTVTTWTDLGHQTGIPLLAFIAASQSSTMAARADDGDKDIADGVNALAKFSQKEAEAALNMAKQWLESIQERGKELKKIDEKKALEAMNGYIGAAKENPALLDPAHMLTIVAVVELALLTSSGPSPISVNPTSAVSQTTVSEAAAAQPTAIPQDSSAAIAMIAALMAQVAQAQVIMVQIKEKPEIDSKKVSETFALENAKKIMGFVQDPAYSVFLKQLVEGMVGKENSARNVELVKINMLLSALWLIARAETDGVKFIEIAMIVRQYLSGDVTKKLPFAEGDIRYKLLGKIKENIQQFSTEYGSEELEKGLLSMMSYMEGNESKDDFDPKDAKKAYAGFLATPAPVDSSKA